MNLEVLIPSQTTSNNGCVHYRLAGEEHPLCGMHRTDWQIISLTDRVTTYAKLKICMDCVWEKRRIENQRMGLV